MSNGFREFFPLISSKTIKFAPPMWVRCDSAFLQAEIIHTTRFKGTSTFVHFFESMYLSLRFIDEKAYLVSIGKELDEGGKKEGKKDNDFLKDFPKEYMEEITYRQRIILSLVQSDCTLTSQRFPKRFGKRTCNTENDKKRYCRPAIQRHTLSWRRSQGWPMGDNKQKWQQGRVIKLASVDFVFKK